MDGTQFPLYLSYQIAFAYLSLTLSSTVIERSGDALSALASDDELQGASMATESLSNALLLTGVSEGVDSFWEGSAAASLSVAVRIVGGCDKWKVARGRFLS